MSASTGATACEGPCAFYLGHLTTVTFLESNSEESDSVSDSEGNYQERQVEKIFQEIGKRIDLKGEDDVLL